MTLLATILGYLLVGFVLHFAGTAMGATITKGWGWELAAIVFWPFTVVVALLSYAADGDR